MNTYFQVNCSVLEHLIAEYSPGSATRWRSPGDGLQDVPGFENPAKMLLHVQVNRGFSLPDFHVYFPEPRCNPSYLEIIMERQLGAWTKSGLH